MKTKIRIQPALQSLSDADKGLLADWLRKGQYEDVLDRVQKPRSEGGFGLVDLSVRPLRTFYAKVAMLDLINSRVSDDKKMSIAQFESLAAGEMLLASSTSNVESATSDRVSQTVHDAVMSTAYDLATSGDNTPSGLVSLQRIADFPVRAELRARKDQRDTEMSAHKVDMDLHRKAMNEKRFTLTERALALRERIAETKRDESPTAARKPQEDALGRLARTLDDVERRTCAKFNLPYPGPSQDPASAEPLVQSTASSESQSPAVPNLEGRALPPGSPPSSNEKLATSNLPNNEEPTPPLLEAPDSEIRANSCPLVVSSPPAANSAHSAPLAVNLSNLIPPLVKDHAIRRWRSHIPRPPGTPEPDGSWREECPCGHPLPCAHHGEMPLQARWYRPQHPEYKSVLEQSGVPFYIPKPEELDCTQEELDRSINPFTNNPQMKDLPDPKFSPIFQPGQNPYVWPGSFPHAA